MWVGVLADTRDALDSRIMQAFEGMDYILHCGNIGSLSYVEQLSHLSPINGVLGDDDSPEDYPFETTLFRGDWGVPILVRHEAGSPSKPDAAILTLLEEYKPKALLFGAGGEAMNATVGKCLWLNPGSASGRNPAGLATVGILEIDGASVRAEIIRL
ncbi:MAG: metallophosphoesterase family protein [Planctomycetes bacterium]|nr:metallophosphoesterase family protein [Planctomycetota bacterium]